MKSRHRELIPVEGWAGRGLLTGLYLFGGGAAGASLAASLIGGAQGLHCLPPVTDSYGDPVSVKNALGYACDAISYGCGVVCALCVMMAISINIFWANWRWCICHQTLTLLLATLSTMCGTALTVDYVLWCHTLQNTMGESSCDSAASQYDHIHRTSNMTAYFSKMQIQQVCQWAVVPFLLCAVVVCSFVMKSADPEHPPPKRQPPSTGRYFLLPDESAPLLVCETSLVSAATSVRARADRSGDDTSSVFG